MAQTLDEQLEQLRIAHEIIVQKFKNDPDLALAYASGYKVMCEVIDSKLKESRKRIL